jgi:hypothetical protein
MMIMSETRLRPHGYRASLVPPDRAAPTGPPCAECGNAFGAAIHRRLHLAR